MSEATVVEKKKFYKKWWFWLIVVIFVLGVSVSPSPEKDRQLQTSTPQVKPEEKPEQKVEAIKLTAESLMQAYKENEVSGDNLYKGKLVEISGTVDTIGKDIIDKAYITFETLDSYSFNKVQCMFNKAEENNLAQLRKGQAVKVQGVVSGAAIGSVIVKNCVKL